MQRIEQLEQKIDLYINNAQKQGEEGNIEESEAIMNEVEKQRAQKKDLEAILQGGVEQNKFESIFDETKGQENPVANAKPDRNMEVCEICGALQSSLDTESRMQLHL